MHKHLFDMDIRDASDAATGSMSYISPNRTRGSGIACRRDRLGQLPAPLGARAYALVIPDVETLLAQPLNFPMDASVILVGIAHENVGLITLTGRESPTHVSFWKELRARVFSIPRLILHIVERTDALLDGRVACEQTEELRLALLDAVCFERLRQLARGHAAERCERGDHRPR